MVDVKALLGTLMRGVLSESSASRIEHALSGQGGEGAGAIFSQVLDAVKQELPTGVSTTVDNLAHTAQNLVGEASGALQRGAPLALGGLAALAGAVLGGGRGALKGALGGGALAFLAGLASDALKGGTSPGTGSATATPAVPLGLREPANAQEEHELDAMATVVLKAMINAAKADGQIDATEKQRILSKLEEAGADAETRAFVEREMAQPLNLDALLQAVPNLQRAAEVYAASLLAIAVDTPAEREYLQRLAQGLGLQDSVVQGLHTALGVQ